MKLSFLAAMSLSIASLNSGSNGNCYYIGNQDDAILIDAGISCRETEKRMKRLELSIKKVKAIFITHEHADHIAGVAKISKKYKVPVYITNSTRTNSRLHLSDDTAIHFRGNEAIRIGSFTVTALPKFHDAVDPHNFIVECNQITVGVFTDIGKVCGHLKKHFATCHAAFLEANYEEGMLETGGYPLFLKDRIRDGMGHLSNKQALQLFVDHKPPFMSHLLLSHLSKHNNNPEIVEELFKAVAGSTKIIIASRKTETPVYQIGPRWKQEIQLSLFDEALMLK